MNSWNKSLQIMIPMAGRGSRFAPAGYVKSKPFIDVAGRSMIERVIENVRVPGARYVLIPRVDDLESELQTASNLTARGDVRFEAVDFATEGAACTALTARASLEPQAPLLIANCDQIVDFDCAEFVRDAELRNLDGSILCFRDETRDPKWSFVRLDHLGFVTEVREKEPISELATVGIYWFRRAEIFINAAIDMICRNERVNGEFYVCPVFNYVLRSRAAVGAWEIPAQAMHSMGTPTDLAVYLQILDETAACDAAALSSSLNLAQ